MLTFTTVVMLAVLPVVLLVVFTGITGLPSSEYEKTANARACSILYETEQVPERVTVIGRDIAVRDGEPDVSPMRRAIMDERQWQKAMIEQAMVNTCITMHIKCGKKDVDLLWAFMPNVEGPVSEIVTGSALSNLDCDAATDVEYARYGRHLFKEAIEEQMLSVTHDGNNMNYHYSRPVAGSGCSFYDMVDLR